MPDDAPHRARQAPLAEQTRSPWQERIQIGGFQPFSTVDWPHAIVAVVFLRGCPWRCGYCHNPGLQRREGPPPWRWAALEAELVRRQGWLDGVVFSGGEPTTDRALPEAVARVRELGFRVGLHTGGAYPERLATLLPHLDWVGFDIKTSIATYDALTGTPGSGERAERSARMLVASGVAHEFRMTYHGGLIDDASVVHATDMLAAWGVQHFVVQEFRREGVQAELPEHAGIPPALMEALRQRLARVQVREPH